ncbi:MAG: fibronectin, partial [Actinobacteria bacterium]|nr:fibronectin [Actinomycetota bacterium]
MAALMGLLICAPILSAPAQAVSVRSIPAGWAYTYGSGVIGKSAAITAPPTNKSANIEKKSTFIINYNTVPLSYQPAIQAAVDSWSQYFSSSVPIRIDATYGRQSSLGILASSSPVKFFLGSTFSGGPDNDIWYPSAMANALAKKDLDISNPEITIRINSNITPLLYLGTDGKCPAGLYDLQSIIIHELAHGLGFISNDDILYGYGSIQQATPFDAYAQLSDGSR